MLHELTVHSFAPHVGQVFVVPFDDGTVVHLTLGSATALGHDEATRAAGRSFVLEFEAPGPPYLRQGTFHMHHDRLGEVAIFLVPLGLQGDRMRYEAVFHRG